MLRYRRDRTMNPSERIRAALARPEATRHTAPPPELEAPAEVESTLPLLGATDEPHTALPASDVASNRGVTRGSSTTIERGTRAEAGKKSGRPRRIYVAFGLVAITVVSAIVVEQRRAAAPKPAQIPQGLQVQVKSEGQGLLSIRWNPQSAPVRRAREGRLIVTDPNQQSRIVQLGAEELKAGHVYYQSSVDRLNFELEVTDASGGVVKESIVSIAPEAAPAAAAAAPAQTAPPNQNLQAKAQTPDLAPKKDPWASTAQPEAEPPPTIPEDPKPSTPAPREFTPPPQTEQPRVEPTRAVVLDPSSAAPAGISAPARVNLPPVNVLPPPGATTPSSKGSQPGLPTGGKVQPALLLKKVAPVYPPIARTARIQGTVQFSALIDKNGRVQNLRLVSGPQMLVQPASEAVSKWIYRPMLLDGKPTEVITQIEVRFSLSQ